MAGPGFGRRHSDRLQQQQQQDAAGTPESSEPPQESSEQASTSAAMGKAKKRGPYMGFSLLKMLGAGGSGSGSGSTSGGGKVMTHFPPGSGKPGGSKQDGTLSREIGLIARTDIPLEFKKWDKVPAHIRAQLMERVHAKFIHDAPSDVFDHYCLETFKARFKEHRGEMSKHFKKFASEEVARANPYVGISVDDWTMICSRFAANDFKKLSKTNTKSWDKLRWNHLAGTKSFMAHHASLQEPDTVGVSREVGEIEFFQNTHQYPGGA